MVPPYHVHGTFVPQKWSCRGGVHRAESRAPHPRPHPHHHPARCRALCERGAARALSRRVRRRSRAGPGPGGGDRGGDRLRHHPRLPLRPRTGRRPGTSPRGAGARCGDQLRDVVPEHGSPERRTHRLRARHPGRSRAERAARTPAPARGRRAVARRDAGRTRPGPRPPRRRLLRRLARAQPGPSAARTARVGHPARPGRPGEGRAPVLRLDLRRFPRHVRTPPRCGSGWPPGWSSPCWWCRSCGT